MFSVDLITKYYIHIMRYIAYKKRFDFALGNHDKYLLFLKKHFTETTPTFYIIIAKKRIKTTDGIMWMVSLAKDIENPEYDVIAECKINGENIYLWDNHCWGIALRKNGDPARTPVIEPNQRETRLRNQFDKIYKINQRSMICKTLLLFRIGTQEVE